MKKIFLAFLFCVSFLFADNDVLDTFLDDQIVVESQLLDTNLSDEQRLVLEREQESSYDTFLFYYVTNKESLLSEPDPNRVKAARVRTRLYADIKDENTYAVMRDEVRLSNLEARSLVRKMTHDILWAAQEYDKKTFQKKVFVILDNSLSHFQPLDTSKYFIPKAVDQSSTVIQELNKDIADTQALDIIITQLSSRIVHHSTIIYDTARLSHFKFFALAYRLSQSVFGQKINAFMAPLEINSTQLSLIILLLILSYVVKKILGIFYNKLLKRSFHDEEDISFIHSKITRILNIILIFILLYFILLVIMGVDDHSIWIDTISPLVFVALFGLLAYRVTSTVAALKIEKLSDAKILRKEVINLGIKAIYGIIFIISLMSILKILGVDLTTMLGGLGIGGAAIAFAAKDSISNIFGSISILMGNVFEQGDWIEAGDANGTVVEIGLRATTVRTFDNSLVSIPNSVLANQGIRNWSRRSVGRRIKMSVGVTYESDFRDIRSATDEIIKMLLEHPEIADDRTKFNKIYRTGKLLAIEDYKGIKNTTMVFLDEFADSSINILIYCFSRTVVWKEWLAVKEDVMYKIAEILEKNNLEFAYPALTIHQADDKPREISEEEYSKPLN